jgi:hypothetical protein
MLIEILEDNLCAAAVSSKADVAYWDEELPEAQIDLSSLYWRQTFNVYKGELSVS